MSIPLKIAFGAIAAGGLVGLYTLGPKQIQMTAEEASPMRIDLDEALKSREEALKSLEEALKFREDTAKALKGKGKKI